MRVEIHSTPVVEKTNNSSEKDMAALQCQKRKAYESDDFDQDIIDCPKGRNLDRVILTDIQLTSKSQIDDLKQFLDNASNSFNR